MGDLILLQLKNAYSSILCKGTEKYKVVNWLHSENANLSIIVTEVLDILILVTPEPANAYSPIVPVSEFGKVIVDKDVQ